MNVNSFLVVQIQNYNFIQNKATIYLSKQDISKTIRINIEITLILEPNLQLGRNDFSAKKSLNGSKDDIKI